MLTFTVNIEDAKTIDLIASKAQSLFGFDRLSTVMDLKACHANGCKLDLTSLSKADDFNLAHDLTGINRHLNHETGALENCFLPRFAIQ